MYSGSETALRFQLIIADVSVSVDRSGCREILSDGLHSTLSSLQ